MILAGSNGFYNVPMREKIMEAIGGKTGKMLMIPFAASDTRGAVRERTGAVMAGFRQEDILIYDLDGGRELMEHDYDFICVPGGNTFRLLSRIREEGLDGFIREQYRKGAVYMGFSAGACISLQKQGLFTALRGCTCRHQSRGASSYYQHIVFFIH